MREMPDVIFRLLAGVLGAIFFSIMLVVTVPWYGLALLGFFVMIFVTGAFLGRPVDDEFLES